MKVLIVSSGPLPLPASKGGAVETLMTKIIDRNEETSDFEFTIISSDDQKGRDFVNTNVHYVKNQTKYYQVRQSILKGYRKLVRVVFKKIRVATIYPEFITETRKILITEDFDAILILSLPELVLPIRKFFKKDIILYLHNDHLNKSTLHGRKIIRNCNKILTVSDYIKAQVLGIDSSYRDKVITVLNGCEISKFNKLSESNRIEIRNKYGLTKNDIVIIFSGRLHPTKGILELLTAFNRINLSNLKLLVVGGNFFDSKKKNRFEKKLMHIANQNVIFTGFLPISQVADLLKISNIAAVPSLFEEPCSLSVLEAQAAGLPLIATSVGGTTEITTERSSIILDKNNPDFVRNLEKAIINLYYNKELRYSMGAYGIKQANKLSMDNYYINFTNAMKN